MTRRPYREYAKIPCRIPERPDILRMVDAVHGVIYINTCAADDAKIIYLMTEYCTGLGGC